MVIHNNKNGLFSGNEAADTVLLNGKIITVDNDETIVEALAIRNGKIVEVGLNESIKRFIRDDTRVIDLNSLTATPGLIDSHIHLLGEEYYKLDLSILEVKSIADVILKIQQQVELVGPNSWIEGKGLSEGHLVDGRLPTAEDIDPVSPDNPVFLLEVSHHLAVVNSAAMKIAGIDKDTLDPEGGIIDRNEDGYPTGILRERAKDLVADHIPPLSYEQERDGLVNIVKKANSLGLTAIINPGIDQTMWDLYQDLLAKEELTVRSAMLWKGAETVKEATGLIDKVASFTKPYISTGDDMLWSQGIKMFLDGVPEVGSTWTWDEHKINYDEGVNEGYFGYTMLDPDLYKQLIKIYHDAGLHVQTHAIGDRAVDWVVECHEAAIKGNPLHGLRHGVIHADYMTDWGVEKVLELQEKHDAGYLYSQPVFMWWCEIMGITMGPELMQRVLRLRTYIGKGILCGYSTDYGVCPMDPKYSLWAAVAREALTGRFGKHPYGKEEAIGISDALRGHTMNNAYLLFMEGKIGSLEAGKYADIAIWDKDMYTIQTDHLKDLECYMTLLEGEIVYESDKSSVYVTTGKDFIDFD